MPANRHYGALGPGEYLTEHAPKGEGHNHPDAIAYYTACPACVGQRDTMYDMSNDRLFSLRIPSAMFDALEQLAEDEGRTVADVVRRAVTAHLSAKGKA